MIESSSKEYRKQLLDALKGEKFDSILELGCGYGCNLFAINNLYPDVKCYGIDTDSTRIKTANKRIIDEDVKNVIAVYGDATNIDIPDNSYDIVFTYALLIYLNDDLVEKIIGNMMRIARKKIILIELHSEKSNNNDGTQRYSRNYSELLYKLGVKDVMVRLIPKDIWAGICYKNYGYVIKATI